MANLDLRACGIEVERVLRNPSPATLYQEAMKREKNTAISNRGALIAYSGGKTGRSPNDKRVVKHPDSEQDVWWGTVNIALEPHAFAVNRERATDYLNTRDTLYVVDGFAGWDPEHRVKVRVICARPYHALFMHNMLIRPERSELESYGEPDCVIYNAGAFPANRHTTGMSSKTSVDLSIEDRELVILGTEYAGEMKKGVFTLMNYFMPKKGVLSMHCSATAARDSDESSVLFGLSGTGKTTLSADPNRLLVGDDEHCWTDSGIFNIEGGCYAKAIYLTREAEPQIFDALRFGAVLENVVYDEADHHVDFADSSITENTRGSYPIEFVDNAKIPCVAGHPRHVIFLTCDAFGVLPPVSKLTPDQAEYHFISGYTAKVAGTEVGVTEPKATFSPCFGGPFLVWHPGKYADLLAQRLRKHGASVWLVNTGWTGGPYGVGSRMKLGHTRAIIDAIYSGELESAPTRPDPVFGVNVVTSCPNVPSEPLVPQNSWKDQNEFQATSRKLAELFIGNFDQYAGGVRDEVRNAGPSLA
ncbi:MAG: phosphoenolpyruvate carboxykinase (ATP) [Planctomycetota bacterium]|nr:MAG: phosphoenolpyruvate carboxykinase (ATP) [Planctomycetota bacterium]REJ94942.1 MAG: phosphoenolpyruvate carboxykinase (ATP) [Planctomycetota bacterium]REK22432.1 MAG: phosphoenolpyruvate carboxykinase (ATP) [Planctomycetota bacterium]REK34918.1 MAG: phosphoenolpyruvate carboxykinase (ATP) [Planctomycetota bacterium]